jgi:esterase FrsA
VANKTGRFHSYGFLLLFLLLIAGGSSATALAAPSHERGQARSQAQASIRLPGYPSAWKGERTFAEIKAEVLRRAKLNIYPLTGVSPADVQEAFKSIHALGKNEWGPAFITIGDRYMAQANQLAKSNPAEADADYLKAWRVYSFGRWPVAWSSGRKEAYRKALEAYRDHAKFFDPPLQILRIPYAGSHIVAYLRLPKQRKGPVPLVIAISGLDGRKEDFMELFSALLPYGVGVLTVDGPGTGEAPVKFGPTADRMFSRLLDYLDAQPEIDKTRIAVYGASLGAYWATKLAYTEHARLKLVVPQSPGAVYFFQKKWIVDSLLPNREYVYAQVPALMYIMKDVNTLSQFETAWAADSLAAQHLIGEPSAPMLIISGAKDTQVPFADTILLLESGSTPKYAWINPAGGHMGREVHVWSNAKIFHTILLPWLVWDLQPSEAAQNH